MRGKKRICALHNDAGSVMYQYTIRDVLQSTLSSLSKTVNFEFIRIPVNNILCIQM